MIETPVREPGRHVLEQPIRIAFPRPERGGGPDRRPEEHRDRTRSLGAIALGTMMIAVVLMPVLRPAGPGNTAPVDAPMLLALVLTFVWAIVAKHGVWLPLGLSIAVYMTGGALGALVGPLPMAGLLAVLQDLFLLLWAASIANLARTPQILGLLLRTWVWAAAAWAGFLIFTISTGNLAAAGVDLANGTRAALTFGDPNLAADYFFVSFMVVWATSYPRSPLLRVPVLLGLATALLLTGSNGGILALALGVGLMLLVAVVRRIGWLWTLGFAAVGLIALYTALSLLNVQQLQTGAVENQDWWAKYSVARSPESLKERSLLFHESVQLYLESPLLGSGPTSTKTLLQDNQASYVKEAHDDFLAALVERGAIGFFGLIMFLLALAARTWAVSNERLSPGFAAVVPKPAALGGALLGVVTSAMFYETLHFRHLWLLFGVIGALYLWGGEE